MKTDQDQIKALAELDGWTHYHDNLWVAPGVENFSELDCQCPPPYLTSYDAVIPLVQKQRTPIKTAVWHWMQDHSPGVYSETPAQLAEALLRATNKWKD
jgi:hypothetical protein